MAELEALQTVTEEIRALGAEIVALSPELPEHGRDVIARRKLTIPILRDEGNVVAGLFGLSFRIPEDLRQVYLSFGIDLPASNGEDSQTLPMPARYVIDPSGGIRYARVHPDYTRRPEPVETLDALRELS